MVQKGSFHTVIFIYKFSDETEAVRAEKIPNDGDTLLATIRAGIRCSEKSEDTMGKQCHIELIRNQMHYFGIQEFKSAIDKAMAASIAEDDPILVQLQLEDENFLIPEDKLCRKLPTRGNTLVLFIYHCLHGETVEQYEEFPNSKEDDLLQCIKSKINGLEEYHSKMIPLCELKLPAEDDVIVISEIEDVSNHFPDIMKKVILKYLPLEVHFDLKFVSAKSISPKPYVRCNKYPKKIPRVRLTGTADYNLKGTINELSEPFSDNNKVQPSSNVVSKFRKYQFEKENEFEKTKKIVYNDLYDLEPNYVGLVNQAMTCYLNSLLQALYMTPEFRNALYNWEYKSSDKDSEAKSIPFQLQKLFLLLQTSTKLAVETTSLTRSFGWDSTDSWHQHDIQELCRVMFDALEQKFKNTAQADLINRLYEGKINDYVKCLTCNTEKSREDTFLDIALPVRSFDTSVTYSSVEEALEAFVKYELLDGNNQYFCEKCDKKSNAHKGLKFSKFPYILTIQLKRFDFDHSTFYRIKLNDKVTFPDILNLNSFIESENEQNSPSREEDAGIGEKCSINCNDNNSVDNESISYDTTTFDTNHVSNHDDDDEGIGDMSNGLSSSSCNSQSFNIEKMREKYAKAKGPYIYELFSIMIHSGSASGGHYYAYIKDFRTNKWLCFNDQTVKPITQEDIIKSYGGGARGTNFSASYRCSTNAYMLMYRQIDPERNVLPMKTDDFPPHIKTLLERMRNESYPSPYQKRVSVFEKTVYYRHPTTKNIESVKVQISMNYTLNQLVEIVHSRANLENLVFIDQCRIVSYAPKYDIIERDWSSYEMSTLECLSVERALPELFLEIREKDEEFKKYPLPVIYTKVYVFDAIKKELADGPKYIRAHSGSEAMTIREYKAELVKHFNLDPKKVIVFCQEIVPSKLLDDEYKFKDSKSSLIKITVSDSYDPDTLTNFSQSVFYEMSDNLYNLITFYINSSSINEKNLEAAEVPPYEDCIKENGDEYLDEISTNLDQKFPCTPTLEEGSDKKAMSASKYKANGVNNKNVQQENGSDNVEELYLSLCKYTLKNSMNEKEDWNKETSNSEDSSLSDSDKTLVGDAPDETELECDSALSPTTVLDGVHHGSYFKYKNKREQIDFEGYFKITPLSQEFMWKITMDSNLKENDVKEHLAPYLRIPTNYFRIVDCNTDDINSYHSLKFREDRKYFIEVGRIVQNYEKKIEILLLEMSSSEPLKKSFSIILDKHMEESLIIQQILAKLKKNFGIDLPSNRVRLLAYKDDSVSETYSLDAYSVMSYPICLQELPDESKVSKNQALVYARKWSRSELVLEPPQEVIVDKDNFESNLIDKISSLSEISKENLEFTLLPVKKLVHENIEGLYWRSAIAEIDLTTYLLYRDSKETPKAEDNSRSFPYLGTLSSGEMRRMSHLSSTSSCSPRREKALKIHVDST